MYGKRWTLTDKISFRYFVIIDGSKFCGNSWEKFGARVQATCSSTKECFITSKANERPLSDALIPQDREMEMESLSTRPRLKFQRCVSNENDNGS